MRYVMRHSKRVRKRNAWYLILWRGITANKVKMCDDISNFSDDICNLYYDTYILTDENYNLHDC